MTWIIVPDPALDLTTIPLSENTRQQRRLRRWFTAQLRTGKIQLIAPPEKTA